jgi:hypothetical protein
MKNSNIPLLPNEILAIIFKYRRKYSWLDRKRAVGHKLVKCFKYGRIVSHYSTYRGETTVNIRIGDFRFKIFYDDTILVKSYKVVMQVQYSTVNNSDEMDFYERCEVDILRDD